MIKRQKEKKRIVKKKNNRKNEIQPDIKMPQSAAFNDLHVALLYEVFRLKKRLKSSTKENINIDSLNKAISRMENVFQEHDYEIVDHTGCEYDERIAFDEPRFVQSSEVPLGKSVITKVIYPQINYKDKAIKRARVEISRNED